MAFFLEKGHWGTQKGHWGKSRFFRGTGVEGHWGQGGALGYLEGALGCLRGGTGVSGGGTGVPEGATRLWGAQISGRGSRHTRCGSAAGESFVTFEAISINKTVSESQNFRLRRSRKNHEMRIYFSPKPKKIAAQENRIASPSEHNNSAEPLKT